MGAKGAAIHFLGAQPPDLGSLRSVLVPEGNTIVQDEREYVPRGLSMWAVKSLYFLVICYS